MGKLLPFVGHILVFSFPLPFLLDGNLGDIGFLWSFVTRKYVLNWTFELLSAVSLSCCSAYLYLFFFLDFRIPFCIGLEMGGEINIVAAIQVAQLALKHRQNKHQQQRIIVFAGR
jgi:hypothetical protein